MHASSNVSMFSHMYTDQLFSYRLIVFHNNCHLKVQFLHHFKYPYRKGLYTNGKMHENASMIYKSQQSCTETNLILSCHLQENSENAFICLHLF